MADIESNIKVNIDTSDALSQLKLLQQQISAFQQAMKNAGQANAQAAAAMQQNLMTSINATGKFSASIQTIKTSAESFTESLEKNKLSIGQYFKYAGGASKTFGKLFKSEFETIQQVAVDRVKTIQTQYIKLGRDASGAMKAISVRPLALDMNSLATKTQIAAQKQQLFNQLMKQGSTQLLNFGKNTQWAGRQLMVGFTIPLTLMGQAAAQAYMKIEAASLKFRRVYGDMNTTTEETTKMVKSVQALATEFTKYGIAVADTMDMAAQAAAMGKTGADLMAQVAQASKLAVLGQVEQQQALETTISLTNAFGISTDELAKSVDFLNAVENQTVVSIEDLTIAIPKAAPVIKQLGGDVEDLTFFLTAMKEGGINASEGANALKSGLASMINPTKKASDFLAKFGVNIQGIVEGNKGDIKGTVVDFAKALDTLDPLNRARAIEQMFGKFQFSRLSTLFKNVVDEGSQAATVAGLANQTAEELAVLSEREMSKISDSPMFKFQKSIQDMQAKLAPVGEAFLKAVTPIIEFVTKILDGFNNLSEGTKSFVSILVLAVAGIGPALLMTFGLIANGVANIMKLFTNLKGFINKTTKPSDILGEQTSYMNTEQLKSAAIAASLDQAHAKLRQTFTSEAAAVQQLTDAYKRAVQAQQAYSGIPGIPTGGASAAPKKYAGGVSMVPGPAGAGDIVPALLSPGEAVIPARSARKYAPVIRGMIAGNLPGFEEGTAGAGMRQSMIGPMTQKQTEGIARTGKTLKEISDEVLAGPYGQVPVTNYGTQISPSLGHSFPAFGIAGVYQKPDGSKVFVKPQRDLVSAMAEIRGTTIARDAHGLVAPEQALRVMMDPTDPENKRKFLVLESALDDKIANIPTSFSKSDYFKQLVASLLRGDKDLGIGNLGGNILADVGPAGVFQRASGKRELGGKINSMEEQAIINLLGVKGGAKRFFAESTADIAKSMTPAEYDAAMKAEIQAVAPRLQATIAGFGNLSPEEKKAYTDMQQRLQAGMGVDWGKYQLMHSAVPPKKLAEGGFVGIENSQSFAQSLMRMSSEDINKQLRIQDTHLVDPIDITKNPQAFQQIKDVLPGVTKEELRGFEPVSNLTAQLPGNMNQKMKPGGPGYPPQMFASIWDGFVGKLSKSATIAGIDLPSSQIIEDELGKEIRASGVNINDPAISEIVGNVLGKSAKIEKQKLYGLALRVAQLRSKPLGLSQSENDSIHSIALRMLRNGSAQFNDNGTSLVRTIGNGNITRFGTWEYGSGKYKVGSDKADATIEEVEIRRRAREAAYGANGWATLGNFNAPMPTVNRKLVKPSDWNTVTNPANWNRMTKVQQDQYLSAIPGTDPTTLSFRKQDYEQGFGNSKGPSSEWTYDSSKLKPGIKWNLSQTNMQLAYNEMSRNGIIPAEGMKYFNNLAAAPLKLANGVFSVPGPKGAGDVVPAMLSPGEAVIPAKQAGRYRPMIRQMIAGNLPGYLKGTPGVGINSVFSSETAMESGKPLNVNIVKDETGKSEKSLEVLQKDSKVTILTRQQIEEQMSIEDDVYRQLLEKEKELKLKHVLTEEERKLLEENRKLILRKEEAFKLEKNVMEKEKKAGLFTRNKTTGAVQGTMYGLSAAAGLASTVPGAVGESAQQMLPVIGAATAAMSVIPGYAGMIVGAGAALVTAYMQVQDKLNKIRDEAMALGTAMGSSTKSIDKFAEFAKTVTGSQAMDKRRETSAGTFFNVVQGKTTFGESYMKSDAGKELVKSVGQSIKSGGLDQAKSMIVSQLSTAIASGALSPAQARSIASNLGAQLGDMSLGIEVAGRITDLVGPKGEDLKKEPLEIRMRLVADSVEQFKKQAEIATSSGANVGKNAAMVGGGYAAGAGVGAAAGLGVAAGASLMGGVASSSAIVAGLATAGSAVPVIGTIIGALVGFGIMAVQVQGEIVKNAGYLQASLGSALSVQQQMVDSLSVDYEKRIASAIAAGDIAEATRLQNQYLADQAELLQFNKEQTQEMYAILNNQATGFFGLGDAQTANLDAARESLKKAFEGTGQEVQAKLAQEQIDSMSGSNVQKTMLMSAVAQKSLGINQIGVAKNVFGADQAGADTLQTLMENSPTELNRTLGLAGNMGAAEQKKFVIDMSLKDPIEAKVMNDAVELAQKTTGVFFGEKKTAEAIMKFAVENPEKMLEFQQNVEDLKNEKKIDITVATKILGPDLAKALGEKSVGEYLKKYNKQNKVVFLSEFQQVMTMLQAGDKDMLASYNKWNAENGFSKTYADYASWQSDRTVTAQGQDNQFAPGEGGATGEATGPQASILDQFVQMARETSNFQQKLTTGWSASYAALKNYTVNSINLLAGWAVRLKQQGVSANMIDVFMGATEEEQDRILDKRTGKLKAGALALLQKLQVIQDKKEFGLTYVLASPTERLEKDNALYQAGLDVIATKEKKINDKYDQRIKALDEIGKAQERNNAAQQGELDVAEALSRGDIAAAAKAAYKMRQDAAQQAIADAKERVELARKNELGKVNTKIQGENVSRADLEEKIRINSEKIVTAKKIELDRQISIGKNAVIAADASARLLANSKLIGKLPGKNTPSGTGTEETNPGVDPVDPVDPVPPKQTMSNILGSLKDVKSIFGEKSRALGTKFGKMLLPNAQSIFVKEQEALQTTAAEKMEGSISGLSQNDQNSIKQALRDGDNDTVQRLRGKLTADKKEQFDEFSADWTQATANIAKPKEGLEAQKTAMFNKLPKEVQAAYTFLKEFGVGMQPLQAKATAAAKELKDFLEINPRVNQTAAEKKKTITLEKASTAAYAALANYSKKDDAVLGKLTTLGYGATARKLFAGYAMGGMVAPMGYARGGGIYGTDTVPAMLTPGEFVIKKSAVDNIGSSKLNKINNGMDIGDSVYNYTIQINVKSESNAKQIADTVLKQIERVDAQRLRGVRI